MYVARTQDAVIANAFVNHPEIRPFVGSPGAGYLDLTDVIRRPEHWFLLGDHGGFGLLWSAPGVYEVHTFITKAGRGAWANNARTEMLDFAKQNGAKMLWTRIPPASPHIERFARQGGMQPTGEVVETFDVPHRIMMVEIR